MLWEEGAWAEEEEWVRKDGENAHSTDSEAEVGNDEGNGGSEGVGVERGNFVLGVEGEVVGGSEAMVRFVSMRKGGKWKMSREDTYNPKTPKKTLKQRHQKAASFQIPGGRPVLVSKRAGVALRGGFRTSRRDQATA
jgi:hypothetical protein